MRGPRLFNPKVIAMLSLMEGSTDVAFWAAEVHRRIGVSEPTAKKYFNKFCEVGLSHEVQEDSFALKNPARNRCLLTPLGVDVIRLFKEST